VFLWLPLLSSAFPIKIYDSYSIRVFVFLFLISYVLGWSIYFSLSHNPIPIKIANCVLTTASFLLIFGLLELPALLGVVDYRSIILPTIARIKPWEDPRFQIDNELLWIRRPYQRFAGQATGDLVYWLGISTQRRYPFDLQYDSRGFRNDHEIKQATMVVIGDSMVEWGYVPHGALVSTRLSRRFQVEVANLGQPAYGPQQELVVLRRYGLTLQPKIVLWFFFEGNDLLDVQRYETFTRNRDALSKDFHSFKHRTLTSNGLLALEGIAATRHQADGEEARRRSCGFLRGRTEDDRTLYFGYEGLPLSERNLASLHTAQKILLDAQTLSQDAGAKLLFIFVPIKFRVYHEFCKFPGDGYGKKWQPNDLPSRLENWHRAQGFPYLDLTAALRTAAANGELVYFADDGHLNAKGHEVAAETIGAFLETQGWLGSTLAKLVTRGN
jgi:SGNH hydrolase-like domain, acetyltransferase AlgX